MSRIDSFDAFKKKSQVPFTCYKLHAQLSDISTRNPSSYFRSRKYFSCGRRADWCYGALLSWNHFVVEWSLRSCRCHTALRSARLQRGQCNWRSRDTCLTLGRRYSHCRRNLMRLVKESLPNANSSLDHPKKTISLLRLTSRLGVVEADTQMIVTVIWLPLTRRRSPCQPVRSILLAKIL